jgi:hypothetical protein
MVYPLRLVTGARAEDRALIEKSLAHWIGFEGALQGYSFVGASAISSHLGKGDEALRFLDALIARYLKPNTMYLEAGPVMETPLAGAQAIHEMLLQSWGETLRIFPALPSAWKDVVFRDLLAEGAFLVSAKRSGGKTTFVRIESKAGEPATLHLGDGELALASAELAERVEKLGPGRYKLGLRKGERIEFRAPGAEAEALRLGPVPADPARLNYFGLR